MLRLLIAASLATWFLACAGRKTSAPMPPPSPTDPRAEIDTLDRDIETQLTKLGIETFIAPCKADRSCTAEAAPVATCTNPHPACSSSCALADSICKSSARICEIAKELGGTDDYANEKCQRGSESCKAARERCCSCKPTGEL
ncbi:MAG: hypothetical protein AB7T06_28530 [Kofleriaceae bacterium]